MKTIREMSRILSEIDVDIRVKRTDAITTIVKGTSIDKLIAMYPVDFRGDLIGFALSDRWWYEPVFATKQAEWDESVENYINAKFDWCLKHTAY